MLRIAGDFHTHTVHSHGTGTVEDNVRAALDAGLAALAISDHGPGHLFYQIRDLDRYLSDIAEARQKYAGRIEVFSSVEANLVSLDGEIDLPPDYADAFDCKLFGYHKLVRYPGTKNKLHFLLPKGRGAGAAAKNTRAYINAMRSCRVDMVSHPGYGIPIDKIALAGAAAKLGVALEINAKHPEFTAEELRACAETGVKFVIGSDAHSPDRVGDFAAAVQRAEEAGLTPEQIVNSDKSLDVFLDRLKQRRRP